MSYHKDRVAFRAQGLLLILLGIVLAEGLQGMWTLPGWTLVALGSVLVSVHVAVGPMHPLGRRM